MAINADVVGLGTYGVNDAININIVGTGVQTISPTSEFSTSQVLTVNHGNRQVGSSENTLTTSDDTISLMELAGTIAEGSTGLILGPGSGRSSVSGLIINRIEQVQIVIGASDSIFWQVGSSAMIGVGTGFVGNVLAQASITLSTGATLESGRALVRTGAVTLEFIIAHSTTPAQNNTTLSIKVGADR